MKRRTVGIFAQFPDAWDLNEVLRHAGIESKIVTKHAVQINPDQADDARAAIAAEITKRAIKALPTVQTERY